jgi:hypothetical protein
MKTVSVDFMYTLYWVKKEWQPTHFPDGVRVAKWDMVKSTQFTVVGYGNTIEECFEDIIEENRGIGNIGEVKYYSPFSIEATKAFYSLTNAHETPDTMVNRHGPMSNLFVTDSDSSTFTVITSPTPTMPQAEYVLEAMHVEIEANYPKPMSQLAKDK